MEIEQLVYETLLQASSQHPDMLKPAEQKLKEWEIEPGFYSVLFVRLVFVFTFIIFFNYLHTIHMYLDFQRIFSNQSLDLNVRWMSILYFKQGVEKYWRKNIQ